MILDLEKFIHTEEPFWRELEENLTRLEQNRALRFDLNEVQRFHYLYQRASADLGKLMTFSAEQDIRQYLEALVARAYAEIHEIRERRLAFSLTKWLLIDLPVTFRKHIASFWIVLTVTFIGAAFGAILLASAPETKDILLPFSHLHETPGERVARELEDGGQRLQGHHAVFSAQLMTHNIKVSVFSMGLGLTYGIGTLIMMFYNGIILGAVCFDYIVAGYGTFLVGWLLPHGSVEIPAFLLAGQAGMVLAHALIGRNNRLKLADRLRSIVPDLTSLIGGVAVFLVWA
ncbi:MAG: stage II sporulation protein M [Desulfobulbaceae bacterium]|nr:stage II sporulation protein M [Desulfobulbaceae bacterium]